MVTDHEMRMEALRLYEENERLRKALESIIRDINEYERLNNLAPNSGRTECWDSVANAKKLLNIGRE